MFTKNQEKKNIVYYEKMLGIIGSLSRLFSESNEPYIQYRIAENLFCKSFMAENLSRTDCSADASKGRLGIGIKTFGEKNGASMQKVAEFNGEYSLFGNLDAEAKIFKIAELRNKRIETTKRIFELDEMIYHCVGRKPDRIIVHESLMHTIAIEKISSIVVKKNAISFNDGLNEYSFNNPKSTLFKRFITESPILDIPVKILENPFEELEKLLVKEVGKIVFSPIKKQEHIFLPLYSVKDDEKYVPEKSGLNQWNASGRRRDPNEIYIPIPAWINKKYPNFFPPRDESFQMVLPNKKEMSAKLCQDGSKALMSNPNAALGKWLLRDVLNLKELELLSYDKLEEIGLDSVVIYKTEDGKYDIDFTNVNSFEDFYESSKRI